MTTVSDIDTIAAPPVRSRSAVQGFWSVAFAFLIVMAFATLPSPLYGIYRTRDHLSSLMITIVYAIFAGGTIATLLVERAVVARLGRRGAMLAAVGTMMAAAVLLAVWKALPGLLVGRLLTGAAVGLAAGVAIVYLIELRLSADPTASPVRARTIGTAVNVGGLGIGPLIAGGLAQWTKQPLTLPYLVMVALGAVALLGVALAPETAVATPQPSAPTPGRPAAAPETSVAVPRPSTPGRPTAAARPAAARLPVPAAAATIAAFAASGLFAGLSGLFLATTLHHPAHVLSGATLFLVFSAGVAAQVGTAALQASRVLDLGTGSMVAGLVLLVVAVRLSTPSLALFLIAGALIGAGAGAVFKGTTGLVLEAARPEDRIALTSALVIAVFVGLSVPVVGAGIALNQGATAPDTVLGFAVLVGLGVSASGLALRRRPS